MRLLLEYFGNTFKLAELEPLTGKIKVYCKFIYKILHPFKPIFYNGFISMIEGRLFSFYKFKNKLFLKVDNTIFELDNMTQIQLEQKENFNIFSIYRGHVLLFDFKYKRPKIKPALESDTVSSFVSEEDFDFCLFIYNIVKNPERKMLIFKGYNNCH